MLVYGGQTLYTGQWEHGVTSSDGPEMPGSAQLAPSQLFQLYLYRRQWGVRLIADLSLDGEHKIQFRQLDSSLKKESANVLRPLHEKHASCKSEFGLTTGVYNLINQPDVRAQGVYIPLTASCRTSDYMRLLDGKQTDPVGVAWGPLERWYQNNDYEWDLFASNDNDYAMLQEFMTVSNCIGLEYNGGGLKMKSTGNADVTEYTAVFKCGGEASAIVYANLVGVKFSVGTEWVLDNFDRYIVQLKCNPNTMLDLVETALLDPGYKSADQRNEGWCNNGKWKNPTTGSTYKFR